MRDGKLLPKPEEKDLGIFLPAPEKEWQKVVEKNDNAAIVAQSLFGESFEVEMGEQKDKLGNIYIRFFFCSRVNINVFYLMRRLYVEHKMMNLCAP